MTFVEIFDNFKKHSYIRRESWHKDLFIQYRHTAPLMRMIKFEDIPNDLTTVHGLACEKANQHAKRIVLIDNDIRMSADDLFAEDWIDIDNC